jgi:hypothetical protein
LVPCRSNPAAEVRATASSVLTDDPQPLFVLLVGDHRDGGDSASELPRLLG